MISDYSGFKLKAEDTGLDYLGFRGALDELDVRNPQDFVATARDIQWVPNARPPQNPTYVAPAYPYVESEASQEGDVLLFELEDGGYLELEEVAA